MRSLQSKFLLLDFYIFFIFISNQHFQFLITIANFRRMLGKLIPNIAFIFESGNHLQLIKQEFIRDSSGFSIISIVVLLNARNSITIKYY